MESNVIQDLATPTLSHHAATMGYVDTEVASAGVFLLGTQTGDGSSDFLFTAAEGDAFANYYKLELIIESLVAPDTLVQPVITFYKSDGSGGNEYYNVDYYTNFTGVTHTAEAGNRNIAGFSTFYFNNSTYGTGLGFGEDGVDDSFNTAALAVSGRMSLMGMGADTALHGEFSLSSRGFGAMDPANVIGHKVGQFTLGTNATALPALTAIRVMFGETTPLNTTVVTSGTVRLIGYKV